MRDGEADSVILPRIGIRVLSKYNNLHFLEWTGIKNMEDLVSGRKHMGASVFVLDKCDQLLKVWFIKFFLKAFSPAFFYFDIHGIAC